MPTYWPDGMDCHACEILLDRGWFRAGRQCYLPLHDRVCCVPYQFRVDALRFAPTRQQARVVRNMQRFLEGEKSFAKNGKLQEVPRPRVLPQGRTPDRSTTRQTLDLLLRDALQRLQAQGRVPVVDPRGAAVQPCTRRTLRRQGVVFHSAIGFALTRVAAPTAGPAGAYAEALVAVLQAHQAHWPPGITNIGHCEGFINFYGTNDSSDSGPTPGPPPTLSDLPNGDTLGPTPDAWAWGDGAMAGGPMSTRPGGPVDVFRAFADPGGGSDPGNVRYFPAPHIGSPFVTRSDSSSWAEYASVHSTPGPTSDVTTPVAPAQRHTLHIAMVRPSVDTETYRLFKKYQRNVHQEAHWTYSRFQTEFVDTPLPQSSPHYGTFHVQYRMDHQLIMVGVVDILPHCLCSCYLFYDTDFRALALGKYSALWELNWIKQKSGSAVYPSLRYYYLGSYVHNCHKVNYKAEYRPAELLCPVTLKWVALVDAQRLLDGQQGHVRCTRLSDLEAWPGYPESPLAREELGAQDCDNLHVLYNHAVHRLGDIRAYLAAAAKQTDLQRLFDIVPAARGLGRSLAAAVTFAARFEGTANDSLAAFEEAPLPIGPPLHQPSTESDDDTDPEIAAEEARILFGGYSSASSSNESGPDHSPPPPAPAVPGAVGVLAVQQWQPTSKKPKIRHQH